ncbi:MAG: hypothetical protein KDA80_03320 [Planctomycetaceae bacterium]|nr:hypothetical protein [Planctomycetaceae bacterium]
MDLLISLWNVLIALWGVVVALVATIAPWTPLLLWIAFWALAVNWAKLYPVLEKGGYVGVVLLMFMTILVWSMIDIPASGSHSLYGLQVSNLVGKTVYVTALTVIAFLCGSVQLTGCCGSLCKFEEPTPVTDAGHDHH